KSAWDLGDPAGPGSVQYIMPPGRRRFPWDWTDVGPRRHSAPPEPGKDYQIRYKHSAPLEPDDWHLLFGCRSFDQAYESVRRTDVTCDFVNHGTFAVKYDGCWEAADAVLPRKLLSFAAIFGVQLEKHSLAAQRGNLRIRVDKLVHSFTPAAPVCIYVDDNHLIIRRCRLQRGTHTALP